MRPKGAVIPASRYRSPATLACFLGEFMPAPFSLAALGAVDTASLLLALAGGWVEAATSAQALPESFPLLRGHVLRALGYALGHALFHATAEIRATGTVPSTSAEEDPAQRQITFWQAFGLLALCRILFGGRGWHGSGRSNFRRRMEERVAERLAERSEHMTPEERERFRQGLRGRCGFDPATSESKGQ